MSELPTISVITPSFNQGQFLGRTLASVRTQSVPALEHLIFDGGSQDDSLTILQSCRDTVQWVSQSDDGQGDAVNQGIKKAQGEIIGWLNSDDLYYPKTLEAVSRFFQSHPDVDLMYGQADHIDINDQPFEAYPTQDWDPKCLRQICFLCQPAVFFRKRVVDRIGLLDPSLRYCMDYNYWLRLSDAGCRFHHVKIKLAGSRLYSENKTLGNRVAVHQEIAKMFLQLDGNVPIRWVMAYATHYVEQYYNRELHPGHFALHRLIKALRQQLTWNHSLGMIDYLRMKRLLASQASR